jgi:hypothetical protein
MIVEAVADLVRRLKAYSMLYGSPPANPSLQLMDPEDPPGALQLMDPLHPLQP